MESKLYELTPDVIRATAEARAKLFERASRKLGTPLLSSPRYSSDPNLVAYDLLARDEATIPATPDNLLKLARAGAIVECQLRPLLAPAGRLARMDEDERASWLRFNATLKFSAPAAGAVPAQRLVVQFNRNNNVRFSLDQREAGVAFLAKLAKACKDERSRERLTKLTASAAHEIEHAQVRLTERARSEEAALLKLADRIRREQAKASGSE